MRVIEENGKCSLKPIKEYNKTHNAICQAIIIPHSGLKGGGGNDEPFSVISCVNLKYLDLNGEKIAGTEVKEDQNIGRVEIWGQEKIF